MAISKTSHALVLLFSLALPGLCRGTELACTPGQDCREPETGMVFVWVPEGCFRMGCDPRGGVKYACEPDEEPVRKVCLPGFWLAKTPLTRGQLARLRGQPAPQPEEAVLPAAEISWYDAKKLLEPLRALMGQSLHPRLPTEAEWEYACTAGGRVGPYSGGEEPSGAGWEFSTSGGVPHPVRQRPANPFGLYDMSGSVWQWVEDSYHFPAYSYLGQDDPKLTRETGRRSRRGGSYRFCTTCARCANRKSAPPEDRMDDIGVRFALEPSGN